MPLFGTAQKSRASLLVAPDAEAAARIPPRTWPIAGIVTDARQGDRCHAIRSVAREIGSLRDGEASETTLECPCRSSLEIESVIRSSRFNRSPGTVLSGPV